MAVITGNLNLPTARQVPDHAILDAYNKQTYLGNSFVAATGFVAGVTVETPLFLLSNPSTNATLQPQVSLFNNLRKFVNSAPSVVATFRLYSQPGAYTGGTALTPINLRPASSTTSKMTAVTSPVIAGVAQVETIDTVASTAGSLNNTYFLLSSINPVGTEKRWYLWFNVNSTGTDPAVAGRTGIEVDIGAGTVTNANVAVAMRTALNALTGDFVATGATNHVIITNVNTGSATAAADGSQPTGFTFHNTTPGSTNYGTFIDVLTASYMQSDASSLFILDPGQSILVTALVASTANVATEFAWYEL